MDPQSGPPGFNPEQIFAEAAERIQAGEPFEVVVTSYPTAARRQLRELLAIVVVANEISLTDVPVPSESRSTLRRKAFMRAAALHRAEYELAQQVTGAVPATSSFWQRLQQWLAGAFVINNFRPATAALAVVLLLLASTSLVSFAETAIPGDFSYPVKQWIRTQQLYLTTPAERPAVRQSHEQELVEDVAKASEVATQMNTAIKARSVLLFHGFDGDYLDVGDLRVLGRYQLELSADTYTEMSIVGDLTPGATVILRYQILPEDLNGSTERVVQGISLEVVQNQPLEPTPAPLPTSASRPTSTPTTLPANTSTPCVVGAAPPGWIRHAPPEQGESVAEFARRVGANEAEFRNINCAFGTTFLGNESVLVPERSTIATLVPATPTATELATVAAPTVVISATVPVDESPEPAPTVIVTLTLVPEPTETVVISVTVEPPPITPGNTPVITPTEGITMPTPIVSTPVMTLTEAATTVATSTPSASATPTVDATEITPEPSDSATPDLETATPEANTPVAATPTVTEEQPTPLTPVSSPTVVGSITPVATATPITNEPLPTASSTVAPPTVAPTIAEGSGEQPVLPPTSAPTLPPTSLPTSPPPTATSLPQPTAVPTEPPPPPTAAAPVSAPAEPAAVEAAGVAPVESSPAEDEPAESPPVEAPPAEEAAGDPNE